MLDVYLQTEPFVKLNSLIKTDLQTFNSTDKITTQVSFNNIGHLCCRI
jgi:hypothetical protein